MSYNLGYIQMDRSFFYEEILVQKRRLILKITQNI